MDQNSSIITTFATGCEATPIGQILLPNGCMAATPIGVTWANRDVISMPDKWEYPWYAAWDLAFHMVPFAEIDIDFAKRQLILFFT